MSRLLRHLYTHTEEIDMYVIYATPADSWTESYAYARSHEDAQARIDWFAARGYDFIRVQHPCGQIEGLS